MKMRLGVLILVTSVGVLFTGCARTPQAKRDKHLAAGKQFLEKKNYSRAILEFQNAAQAMPTDAETYYELGMAYSESGDPQRGYNNLKHATELNPKHAQAQLELAELMARARDLELVKVGQEELKKLAGASPTPEVLNALARTQLKLGETGDAVQSLQEALKTSPGELSSSIMLALAKLSQKDPSAAEEVLKQASATAPNSAAPHMILGEFYAAEHRGPEAEAEFQKALRIDPKKYPALFDLAQVQNATGEKQLAEQNFKRLADSGEKAYKSTYALFLFNAGRQNEAITEFEKLYKQDRSDRQARTRLVFAYELAHRTADAEKVLAEALKKDPRDTEALSQRGGLFQASGKYVDAEKDLNEVLHLQPDSAEAHYILSKIHKAQRQQLIERQDLSETVRLDPNFLAARIELAEILSTGKDYKSALGVLDEAPANQKRTLAVLTERNWILWASGDIAELRKGIDQGLATARTPDLLIQDGIWKVQTGNFSGGRAVLEEVLKIAPSDVRALEVLYRSYAMKREVAAGVEKVKAYASRQPKSAPMQEYLGMLLLKHGDAKGARSAFNAAQVADPQLVKADFSLVQVDVLEGKLDDARKRLKMIPATDRSSAMAHMWLGNVDLMAGEKASALDEFRKAVEIDGQNAQALNQLAWELADFANRPDEALPYAEKAREIDPSNPDYADTLGWVFYRKGIYTSAIRQMETAASEKQADATIKYHLAMAYAKSGDGEKGRATMQAALKLNPKLPEAQLAASVVGAAK